MTSQLNVDTIVDKAGSGGSNVKMANTSTYVSDGGAVTQNTVQGLCKAWVAFAQATPLVTNTFNVSSATDSATGTAILNLTNNRDSGTEPFTGTGSGSPNTNVVTYEATDNSDTSQARYNSTLSGSSDALSDAQCYTVISGELA